MDDNGTIRSARSRLVGGLLVMVLVAAVMWALMWTVVQYLYWFGPTILLFAALTPVLPEPLPAGLQSLITGVFATALYGLAPICVIIFARRWWWRWPVSGLLLFNVSCVAYFALRTTS